MHTSSGLRGGSVQYGVEGMTPPPMSSALPGVLALCDRSGDERVRVGDTSGLGKVDHSVGDVADTAREKKRVDPK